MFWSNNWVFNFGSLNYAETQSNLALWTGMIHQATIAAVVHMEVSVVFVLTYAFIVLTIIIL